MSLRVPTLCDFEPLNRHVEMLHQLVQAAQSMDEMSRTITDLLNEQRVPQTTRSLSMSLVADGSIINQCTVKVESGSGRWGSRRMAACCSVSLAPIL